MKSKWFYVVAGAFLASIAGDLFQRAFGDSARLRLDYFAGAIAMFVIAVFVISQRKSIKK